MLLCQDAVASSSHEISDSGERGAKNNTSLCNHREIYLPCDIQQDTLHYWKMQLPDQFPSSNIHKGFIGPNMAIYSLIFCLISIPLPITMTTHTDVNQET